ncbi:muramidase family protein [Selenihalanaerobacter shriftii]|uniref:LysM domain-containing protein n=1 Tax=Selenihalanaerobacter shriftii TaxID=142842 RepID=A0A1T4PT53_9FIRM|nr:LysM peptidoglycan-binding domain-containing protein [Selenihalanaerobacter shriftii]SJZ94814.1 LysM domain-containing protein [Selenihalanaerobacter shriftii]
MKKASIIIFLFVTIISLSVIPAHANNNIYKVQSGDTLTNISQELGVPIKVIINHNNINNPSNLYVGQKLVINIDVNYETPKDYFYYTVKSGDILWNIAQKYGTSVKRLVKLNNIKNSHDMYVGRQLVIPAKETQDHHNKKYEYYTVQPGDILWNIAQEYNTTVKNLIELNDIKSSYDLYAGRNLLLPTIDDQHNEPNQPIENSDPIYYFYQVQKNDKVETITKRFGIKISTLLDLNNISNTEQIKAGETLVIPLDKSNKFSYIKRVSNKLNNHYRIMSNELLPDVEAFFDSSEEALRRINDLDNVEEVKEGQKLLMPVSPALFSKHQIYTVKSGGEYIFDIAFNKSVTIRSILKANYLKDGNTKLKAGTTIIVPLDENSKTEWVEYENGEPKNSWLS